MLSLSYYFLKVFISSAVLYGYYWCFLRNKIFHRYNRFYLLVTIILSMGLPLLKFNIRQKAETPTPAVVQMLQVVSSGDEYMDKIIIQSHHNHLTKEEIAGWIFITICSVLALIFITTILRIHLLKTNNPRQNYRNISLIRTTDKRTPFSFLKNIFWNDEIDIAGEAGRRILKHELVHVNEYHTYDKLLINLVLIFFWCNPVFWLLRNEINLLHEFLADKKALEDGDTAAFADMLLQATYPGHRFDIANNFFYSSIKRRISMITKNNKQKVNYISRLLVLPLVLIVIAAFTLKAKLVAAKLKQGKIITIVLDAGHGGSDQGATGIDGSNEKDLNLLLVKKIKALNKDENLKIILTREEDLYQTPKDKAAFTNKISPDLFVSVHLGAGPVKTKSSSTTFKDANIHIGADVPEGSVSLSVAGRTLQAGSDYSINYKEGNIDILNKSIIDAGLPVQVNFGAGAGVGRGLQVFISKEAYGNSQASNLFASAVINSFQTNYSLMVPAKPIQRKEGILILQEVKCPAILIEAGNIADKDELSYLKSPKGQEQFAENILFAISNYEAAGSSSKVTVNEPRQPVLQDLAGEKHNTVPENGNITFKPLLDKIEKDIFIDASQVVITDAGYINIFGVGQFNVEKIFPQPLIIINGAESSIQQVKMRDPGDFDYVRILKPETAVPIYGEKGRQGVFILNTKPVAMPGRAKGDVDNTNFTVGGLMHTRVSAAEFKKQDKVAVPADYTFVSARVWFSGNGFDNVIAAELKGRELSSLKALFDRCIPGTVISFDNIKLWDKNNKPVLVESRIYILLDPGKSEPTLTLSGISSPRIKLSEVGKIKQLSCTDDNYKVVSATAYFSNAGFPQVIAAYLNGEDLRPMENYLQKVVAGTSLTFDNVIISKKDGTDKMEINGRSFTFYEKNVAEADIDITNNKVLMDPEELPKFP